MYDELRPNQAATRRRSIARPFAAPALKRHCPNTRTTRRLIAGVNWSVGINNPFRQLSENGDSLDSFLEMQRVGRNEPVTLLVHLASPRIAYTDRGKSALALGGAITSAEDRQDEEEFEE
jgi:hypothetical protein